MILIASAVSYRLFDWARAEAEAKLADFAERQQQASLDSRAELRLG